jgi:predicted TIM-barrel fold metal-dependent hydrolase
MMAVPGDYCDSHIHVVGDPGRYPLLPTRPYTPGVAEIETVQRLGAPLGISRFVVVQPSFYGTDNTLLLNALRALGDRGRGVAVLDPAAASRGLLEELAAGGVRGLRLNLYSAPGGREAGEFEGSFSAAADLARSACWHVQVIAPMAVLASVAGVLARSTVPVVIDHYGLPAGAASTPDSAEGRAVLGLLRSPHVWMKLSAPYRSSPDELATRPDRAWLSAILAAAAERCVWGSDWPHTPPHAAQTGRDVPLPYRGLDYRAVVEHFLAALPSAEVAARIMRDNPARLYGFAA